MRVSYISRIHSRHAYFVWHKGRAAAQTGIYSCPWGVAARIRIRIHSGKRAAPAFLHMERVPMEHRSHRVEQRRPLPLSAPIGIASGGLQWVSKLGLNA